MDKEILDQLKYQVAYLKGYCSLYNNYISDKENFSDKEKDYINYYLLASMAFITEDIEKNVNKII